jgi:hypothetical protein
MRVDTTSRAVISVVLGLPAVLAAQERLAVTGTFSSGYYNTVTRGESDQSLAFVPIGARFDISSYVLSPDFLDISAQPEIDYGPQASDAGFQGGNGITFRSTFLRKGVTPVTFSYSNVQVEDVYFGSLTQLSGYSLKNRNKDLGITWQYRPANLPSFTVDWGRNSVDSKPDIAGLSNYLSSGSHLNVDSAYDRAGWTFNGFFHRQADTSNLLAPQGGSPVAGSLVQNVMQYEASARRGFWTDSELYVDGGTQSTSSLLITLPVDLSTHYTSLHLRLFQKRRWKSSMRAAYSSNIASQLLAQAASSLAGPGSAAPDIYQLLPFSHGLSSFNLNGATTVALAYGFGLYGGLERNAILSASQTGPINADYFTTSGGLTYAHGFSWGNLSGEYGRQFGVGSVTGQSGTIQGQTYRFGAERGKTGDLIVNLTVHGSDETVENVQPLTNRSVAVEGTVARRIVGRLSARLGGGWQWGDVVNSANDFKTNGYTARAGIEHPRLQLGASLNNTISDSLPFYTQFLGGGGLAAALLAPLNVVPSDYRALSFNLHANPLRKLEASAVWTRSMQHLDGYLSNEFELLNVYVTYHFRRIQIEAGFIHTNQVLASYPDTVRQRFYIRFVRTARIL